MNSVDGNVVWLVNIVNINSPFDIDFRRAVDPQHSFGARSRDSYSRDGI